MKALVNDADWWWWWWWNDGVVIIIKTCEWLGMRLRMSLYRKEEGGDKVIKRTHPQKTIWNA